MVSNLGNPEGSQSFLLAVFSVGGRVTATGNTPKWSLREVMAAEGLPLHSWKLCMYAQSLGSWPLCSERS